jgi:16S rRNA (guanine966-N2)-methyltransferase
MAKRARRTGPAAAGRTPGGAVRPTVGLRIIGGQFRGRHLRYSGDMRTRPMKDRLREAIFNLIGPAIRGKHALDLFAGTGALALEAISRGAARATAIEQHNPTANIIRQNIADLGLNDRAEVVVGNTFIWWQRRCKSPDVMPLFDDLPWVVFCSPPYDFYVERTTEMLELIAGLAAAAPEQSIFVVEADARFDAGQLPNHEAWELRSYPPAAIAIYRKSALPPTASLV